jgi:hypothetical protein
MRPRFHVFILLIDFYLDDNGATPVSQYMASLAALERAVFIQIYVGLILYL